MILRGFRNRTGIPRIRWSSWEIKMKTANRQRVDDLLHLAGYIRKGVRTADAAVHFDDLRDQYPSEYFDLLVRLAPDAIEAEFERRAGEVMLAEEGRLAAQSLLTQLHGWN